MHVRTQTRRVHCSSSARCYQTLPFKTNHDLLMMKSDDFVSMKEQRNQNRTTNSKRTFSKMKKEHGERLRFAVLVVCYWIDRLHVCVLGVCGFFWLLCQNMFVQSSLCAPMSVINTRKIRYGVTYGRNNMLLFWRLRCRIKSLGHTGKHSVIEFGLSGWANEMRGTGQIVNAWPT